MSLYWLCYRLGGSFIGAAVFEASSLVGARRKAALAGLGQGFECAGDRLPDSAGDQIPESLIGRMLSLQELAALELILRSKKPAAASVRRRVPRKRSVQR